MHRKHKPLLWRSWYSWLDNRRVVRVLVGGASVGIVGGAGMGGNVFGMRSPLHWGRGTIGTGGSEWEEWLSNWVPWKGAL